MSIQVRVRNGIAPDGITGLGGVTEGDFRGELSDMIEEYGGVPYKEDDHLLVHENSPQGMSVVVDEGVGWIPNAAFDPFDSDTIKFWEAVNDAPVVKTIASNSSGSTRIDLICLYLNVATSPNEYANNITTAVVVQGTPGAGAPAVPDDHLVLAQVTVVNGAVSITDSNIADARVQPTIKESFIGLSDGWKPSAYTWTYASASSFTIAGVDVTALFPKGTRLRMKQGGGYKYFVVRSTSFSTNTTVNVMVNSDYTIANSSITDNDFSYELCPQGYPGTFTWATTWGGFSANPTGGWRYAVNGNQITLFHQISAAGTSNSTSFSFTVPVAPAVAITGVYCFGQDSGALINDCAINSSGTTFNVLKTLGGGTWTNSGGKEVYLPSLTYDF